ncbi:CSN8/PSMD8/EIF3K family domain-containing protein [Ditylenchus destructor]|uniref:Eukaryotic translation initiation factor 3 subunit K n=1 Tax=Ditylenchus destructor TaxID=166010 RepID=A0AAD4N3C0_9BILA|nr:CSN8/PSMD8/EIF3K family domain-containing protein [Ditylenchus destructor]
MTNFDDVKDEIEGEIVGVNRYNPNNIDKLEACITLMVKENKYDKDVLLTTLKLYQFNPDRYKESYVCQILLKTMMVFPRNDYALAKYLVDSDRVNESVELRRIIEIGAMLESCDFSLFWRLLRNEYKIIDPIIGFEDAVRIYACRTVSVTFQSIDKVQLARLLGNISDQLLASYAKAYKWELRQNAKGACDYFIQNHEDKIKSRNIEEKLRFEQCVEVMKN